MALRFTEDDARRLLLLRAVEASDANDALLSAEDRRQAGEVARGAGDDGRYLTLRADALLARLLPRQPALARALLLARWPGWVDWALPAAALAVGALSPLVDGDRMNILFAPLILMIGWNLIVYALLLARAARRLLPGAPRAPGGLAALPARLAARAARHAAAGGAAGAAVARFANDWRAAAAPLNGHRAARAMHLAAALLAAGALGTLYAQALLAVDYRAGWASTFESGAGAAHALLRLLLGPASAATGIALPTAPELDALRWSANPQGVSAAPWIHLWAVAALLFIIAPRLLLVGWHGVRAARLARRLPVPLTDGWARRLLRERRGGGGLLLVQPYSHTLADRQQGALKRLLADTLGAGTDVRLLPPLAYGGEDGWDAAALPAAADQLLLLFNLSATPEAEAHGAFARAAARGGVPVAALLDESGFTQRLSGQPDAARRLDARRKAWRDVLGDVPAAGIDLAAERADPAALENLLTRGVGA